MSNAQSPYLVTLGVWGTQNDPNNIVLTLTDERGNAGKAEIRLADERIFFKKSTWQSFLDSYVQLKVSEDELAAFGSDLYRVLIANSNLQPTWSAVMGAASGRPIRLTVKLDSHSDRVARLPLELLRDSQGYVFGHVGSGLVRTLLACSSRKVELPQQPRILLAWAQPLSAGDAFDPKPHVKTLRAYFGDRLTVLPKASRQTLQTELERAQENDKPFDVLHMLAHGYRDALLGGVCMHNAQGALEYVSAETLGKVVRGLGIKIAFLCACKSGVSGVHGDYGNLAFTGVGQQLLADRGGDLSHVVATQANLPIKGSATFALTFYQALAKMGPAEALAEARKVFDAPGLKRAWSVPILLSRPEPRVATPPQNTCHDADQPQTGVRIFGRSVSPPRNVPWWVTFQSVQPIVLENSISDGYFRIRRIPFLGVNSPQSCIGLPSGLLSFRPQDFGSELSKVCSRMINAWQEKGTLGVPLSQMTLVTILPENVSPSLNMDESEMTHLIGQPTCSTAFHSFSICPNQPIGFGDLDQIIMGGAHTNVLRQSTPERTARGTPIHPHTVVILGPKIAEQGLEKVFKKHAQTKLLIVQRSGHFGSLTRKLIGKKPEVPVDLYTFLQRVTAARSDGHSLLVVWNEPRFNPDELDKMIGVIPEVPYG